MVELVKLLDQAVLKTQGFEMNKLVCDFISPHPDQVLLLGIKQSSTRKIANP